MKHINVALFVPHAGCSHRCIFCDQRAISGQTRPLTAADIVDACETAAKCPHDRENSEIAFFGGSFTAVDPALMRMCLDTAAPFLQRDFGGIRISTRPDAVDENTLLLLKQKGVTAIELGAQSMDDGVLAQNERGHTAADTVRAAELIKTFGFSLGLQMMTGLYGSSPQKDRQTALSLCALQPDTMRIYPTVVLEGTRLCELYRAGDYTPPSLEDSVSLCAALLQLVENAGVRVIRLGLHAGAEGTLRFVAGPYHPAFRELCEGEIYRFAIGEQLRKLPKGQVLVTVAPGDVSKAAGHGRRNTSFFKEQGYLIKIKEQAGVPRYIPAAASV
ncbi:MAG: radical SAM protein [Clostridia bacterium]|nr:radical SAM protein [Clostridia bacterium]